MDLGDDLAKDIVSGKVIEFSKSGVNTLRVLKSHLRVLVRLEHALWLSIEDDLLKLCGVYHFLACGGDGSRGLIGKAELEQTLTTRDLSTRVTVLLEFDDEPLDEGH